MCGERCGCAKPCSEVQPVNQVQLKLVDGRVFDQHGNEYDIEKILPGNHYAVQMKNITRHLKKT